MTMFTREREAGPARLGIAATRKMGAAVERNRAKRLVRELFRHHKPAAALDVVVVPRREMLDAPYDRLEAEFLIAPRHARRATAPPTRRWPQPSCALAARFASIRSRLSPLFAGSCRYVPGCADYMSESIARFGLFRGGWLGTKRLCRCHPFGGHGFDPVPDSVTTEIRSPMERRVLLAITLSFWCCFCFSAS